MPRKSLLEYRNLSRLPVQNHLRSVLTRAGRLNPIAGYEENALWAWLSSYAKHLLEPKEPFRPASSAPSGDPSYPLENQSRIAVAGDWGTGTEEAHRVALQMKANPGALPDLTMHLGDVYYVGDEAEIRQNCLEGHGLVPPRPAADCVQWPSGARGSLALNGNHEMYANGTAYFKVLLPTLGILKDGKTQGQGPSFFSLENDHWRLVGIDTGYNSVGLPFVSFLPGLEAKCTLPSELMRWLRAKKRTWSPKATILLSHHQCISAFDSTYLRPARQLASLFPGDLLWIWGHEHRLAGYRLKQVEGLSVHGRCIGHGGMPIEAVSPGSNKDARDLLFYDKRRNPLYPPEKPLLGGSVPLGFNGFAELAFDQEHLTITYKSLALSTRPGEAYAPDAIDLLKETFVAKNGAVEASSQTKLTDDPDFVLFH